MCLSFDTSPLLSLILRPLLHRPVHRRHKPLAAVRVHHVVAVVVCYQHLAQPPALRQPCRHGQHNPVAKRHHCRLHVLRRIRSLRHRHRLLQQRRLEILPDNPQRYRHLLDAQPPAMLLRARLLPPVMVAPVVERLPPSRPAPPFHYTPHLLRRAQCHSVHPVLREAVVPHPLLPLAWVLNHAAHKSSNQYFSAPQSFKGYELGTFFKEHLASLVGIVSAFIFGSKMRLSF